MKSVQSLKVLSVWLNPDHLMTTAKVVMKGHGLRAIGIADDQRRLVGVLTMEAALVAADDARVGDFAVPVDVTVDAALPIREAADLFVKHRVDYVPVISEDRFLGLVTASHLLEELRQSWDPLTELPWSDALRAWGVEQLSEGMEIAILFADLNQFGAFNKKYGHVVGDNVLKRFARFLRENTDPTQDLVVRYGGDEFAIGTSRERDDAERLAHRLQTSVEELRAEGAEEAIQFSIGLYGGRRSKERLNVHYGATLDNLINLASKDCLANKKPRVDQPTTPDRVAAPVEPQRAEPKPVAPIELPSTDNVLNLPIVTQDPHAEMPADESKIKVWPAIVAVQVEDSVNGLTHVALRGPEGISFGVGVRMGRSLFDSVSYATAKALEKAYPDRHMQVDQVKVVEEEGEKLVQIEARVSDGYVERKVLSRVELDDDENGSVALATIGAFFAEE